MRSGDPQACYFDAKLMPHRSLAPRGFRILMGVVIGANLLIGIPFLVWGAWPVFGFMGLDILALYLLFKLNYRSGRLFERLRLTDEDFTVARQHPDGMRQHWRFTPYWLRVAIDDPPRHESQLTVGSHGRAVVVGAFLTPEERLEVAHALRQALARQRDRLPPLSA